MRESQFGCGDPVVADVRRLVFVVREGRGQRWIEAAAGRQRRERVNVRLAGSGVLKGGEGLTGAGRQGQVVGAGRPVAGVGVGHFGCGRDSQWQMANNWGQ